MQCRLKNDPLARSLKVLLRSRLTAACCAIMATAAIVLGGMAKPAAAGNFCTINSGVPSAPGTGAFACGNNAQAEGDQSTSLGNSAGSSASGTQNTSVGYSSGLSTIGNGNTATGSTSLNPDPDDPLDDLLFGAGAIVEGNANSAYGAGTGVGVVGDNNSAFGADAGRYVNGSNNVAIGQNAGRGTFATPLTVSNSVAIGANATAGHDNAMAIGSGVTTTAVNQVALGSASNTYTLAGIGSPDSLAAQDPTSIRFVTSDAGGNLALSAFDPSSLASSASVAALDSRVGSLEGALSGGLGKAFEGTAMALAMAGGGLPADKDFAVSINWGAFEGENGFAGSAAARINENMFIHGGIGVGASHGTVGGRAGMTFAW